MQHERLHPHIEPSHHWFTVGACIVGIVVGLLPALHAFEQLARALRRVLELFGPIAIFLQHGTQLRQPLAQGCERPTKFLEPVDALQRHPGFLQRDRQAQIARRFVGEPDRIAQIARIGGARALRDLNVATQIDDLSGAHALAKELRRRIGQLMRFIEHDGVAGRQQLGHAFVAQHRVGKEQVVIDHHDIGRQRVAPRTHHETVVPLAALLAQAVLARRGRERPGRGVLGDGRELAAIAAAGALGKARDRLQIDHRLARRQPAIVEIALQVVVAHVVGAALEQRDLRGQPQRIPHRGQIAMEELILQGLGAGGDERLAAVEQRGHQIGDRLAGAGAGLGDQHCVVGDGFGDRTGQFDLLRADAVSGDRAREWSVCAEHRIDGLATHCVAIPRGAFGCVVQGWLSASSEQSEPGARRLPPL